MHPTAKRATCEQKRPMPNLPAQTLPRFYPPGRKTGGPPSRPPPGKNGAVEIRRGGFHVSPPRGAPFPFFRMTDLRALLPDSSGSRRQAPVLFLSVSSISQSICHISKVKSTLLIISNIQHALKYSDFSQEIHIFFSSKKNVNLLREIRVPPERDSILFATFAFSLARQ